MATGAIDEVSIGVQLMPLMMCCISARRLRVMQSILFAAPAAYSREFGLVPSLPRPSFFWVVATLDVLLYRIPRAPKRIVSLKMVKLRRVD